TCVAFVGGGFSQPAVPGWTSLLRGLAARLPEGETRADVEALLAPEPPNALDLEAAAQIIRGSLGDGFEDCLRETMVVRPEHKGRLQQRIQLLSEIPFASVLTTNFDPFLPGDAPTPEVYHELLRRDPRWFGGRVVGRHTVKLHGDVFDRENRVVLAREDYRARLYQDGRYATFLRAVFATRTVLFLGVSFTDAYLNELRSEVLALLGPPRDHPLAYAFLPDCTGARARYFRSHEGIEVLGYESGNDHEGFDRLLGAVHACTRPYTNLKAALTGRRILWLDPEQENNVHGKALLEADRGYGDRLFAEVDTVDRALAQDLDSFDLLITHYGWKRGGTPVAVDLLRRLRARDRAIPVVIFGGETDAAARRREVQALGALDYCHRWEDLFFVLEAFFRPRDDT
ncbi:MAG: SIR2 family NAD-dependent protein deacylase, partial [Myxococcota bacterium]